MMKKILPSAVGIALLSAAPAFSADSGDLLSCVDRGTFRQKCQLVDKKLADAIVEDSIPYEAQFLVKYDFPCSGHTAKLGVKSSGSAEYFVQGLRGALMTVNGLGDLHPYDPAPADTRYLTFYGGCSLHVTDVTVLPSAWTAQIWSDQAKQEAKVVTLSTELYLLAKDYQNLSSWNVQKLQLLQEKLQKLVDATPANLNYKVMLNSVNSALQNQPPSATLDELKSAGEDVVLTLRGELDKELAVAQGLLDRFARWQLATEQALKDALDNARSA